MTRHDSHDRYMLNDLLAEWHPHVVLARRLFVCHRESSYLAICLVAGLVSGSHAY
jgi:hypothetical protein